MRPTDDPRDDGFERLLRSEVSRPAVTPDACPQVELLSAWFDRALPSAEAAAVETHLAGCARCQEVLGHLARTEPEVLYVHPKPAPVRWTWHLRWAAPLAAAAVVVFAIGTRSLLAPVTPSPFGAPPRLTEAAKEQPLASSPSPAASRFAPPSAVAAEPVARAAAPERALPAAPPAQAAPPVREGLVSARPAPVDQEVAGNASVRKDKAAGRPTAADMTLETQKAEVAREEKLQGAPAPGIGAAVVVPPAPARSIRTLAAVPHPAEERPAAFVPGSPIGWRYIRPGAVLRTQDGGASWVEYRVPGEAHLLALSAVSPTVCWAAGRAGVILRTTDGVTWQVITAPSTGDFASIAALDERRATVRTTTGLTFDTGDAGATWVQR